MKPILALATCAALAMPAGAQIFKITKEQLVELTAKSPYERFSDGRPKVPDAVLNKARGLSVEEIWGVLQPDSGYANQYEGGWQVLHPGMKLVGRAVTAQFMPVRQDLNELLIQEMKNRAFRGAAHQWVIDQLQPGDVLV